MTRLSQVLALALRSAVAMALRILKIWILRAPLCLLVAGALVACVSAGERDPISAGTAKLMLKQGETTQAEALEAFGGPNVVAGTADGSETWTYDRMSYVRNSSSVGGLGGGAGVLGSTPAGGLFWGQASRGASSSRTMTLFLYWKDGVLQNFRYRSASF